MPVDQSRSDDSEPNAGRRRRQHIITVLDELDTPITIDQLTDHIVDWEAERFDTQSSPERQHIREELHQVDLPALDERGLVEFNQAEGLVGRHQADADSIIDIDGATTQTPPPTEHAFSWGRLTWIGGKLPRPPRVVVAVMAIGLLFAIGVAMLINSWVAALLIGGGATLMVAGVGFLRTRKLLG